MNPVSLSKRSRNWPLLTDSNAFLAAKGADNQSWQSIVPMGGESRFIETIPSTKLRTLLESPSKRFVADLRAG
jgi:hypothetical protein